MPIVDRTNMNLIAAATMVDEVEIGSLPLVSLVRIFGGTLPTTYRTVS